MATDLPRWVAELAERLAADGVDENLLFWGAVCPVHQWRWVAPGEQCGYIDAERREGTCRHRGERGDCKDLRTPAVWWPVWEAWAPSRVNRVETWWDEDGDCHCYVERGDLAYTQGADAPGPNETTARAYATAVLLGVSDDA